VILHLMVWHRDNKNIDGLIKHVANNKAWMHINALCPKFATKAHIVKLRLVVDGVNPFGEKSSNWSTWPIFLYNYNLLPWLTTNFFLSC